MTDVTCALRAFAVTARRDKYTGLSKRTLQRMEKKQRDDNLRKILKTTPFIINYFFKPRGREGHVPTQLKCQKIQGG